MAAGDPGPSNSQQMESVYVAVGKDVKECELLLTWVLRNLNGRRICLLHIHQPDRFIPHPLGGRIPASQVEEAVLQAFREKERETMFTVLNRYLAILQNRAEEIHPEADCIEKGIVEQICQLGIKKLVMGAAADRQYRRTMNIRSRKARYVQSQAPLTCHIWFVCKGMLIHTREAILDQVPETPMPSFRRSQSHIPVPNYGRTLSSGTPNIGWRTISLNINSGESSEISSPSTSSQVASPSSSGCDGYSSSYERNDSSEEKLMQVKHPETPASSAHLFCEFSISEIVEATRHFHPSLKIGEGGYGSIYRGIMHQAEVAVKILNPNSLQGPAEYQQEVDILSKLKHPNLVTLIGACPEAWALIYEYLPNGSLEDRLICKNGSPPLSWRNRIRIAAEICSALIFLHSARPYGIIHGDLKPSNVLLDANLVSKIGDFGISRKLHSDENSSNGQTLFHNTNPKGSIAYMDPVFLSTGELTHKSDTYSFGILLLRLLTGKSAVGSAKEVRIALDSGKLMSSLDSSAGHWPYTQAHQLAQLGLKCAEISRKDRPNLSSDVWGVLEPMGTSCGGSFLTSHQPSEEYCQAPDH